MKNSLLLAGTAIALSTVVTPRASTAAPGHAPTTVLWNQNSNFNTNGGIVSDNFTSGSFGTAYNSAAADDFVVPAGRKWSIKQVDVTGVYFGGSCSINCAPTNEIITFYKNNGGLPGAVIGTPQTVDCTNTSNANFSCNLSTPVRLKGGTSGKHYWLSFVANYNFGNENNDWGWTENKTIHGHEAAWENPGGGFGLGCPTWDTLRNCYGLRGDLAFDLKGKSSGSF